jgi:hypothetical protein
MFRIWHKRLAIAIPALGIAVCVLFSGCRASGTAREPAIEFSLVPPAGEGSPAVLEPIEGRVSGAKPGERIVLFAQAGEWWVQPLGDRPFTSIQADSRWKSITHPGSAYAALLVDSRYRPPLTLNTLPDKGGPILAVATAEGRPVRTSSKTLRFSGYDWEIRHLANDPGGSRNYYDPANAWTDTSGFLHLRITRQGDRWMSAEVKLSRSLGYGSYRFVVRDVSRLEPAAVLDLSTWDDFGPPREMHIEISRWGEPEDKNAQFVIQPYVVPANSIRFNAPPGDLTYSLRWEPGQAAFRTVPGSISNLAAKAVAEHVFTSGVQSSGRERIHMNLYVFRNQRHPLQHDTEVVIEKFEFLP